MRLGDTSQIKFHDQKNDADWKITLIDTGLNSLKGSRIKKIEKYIESDTFLLTYGDGVADIDIKSIVDFHKKHGKIATLTGVRPPSRFGDLIIKGDKVIKFTEKPQASAGLINGGYFVFSKKIFDYLSLDENCDFEGDALVRLAKEGQLMVHDHNGSWECMDTFRDTENLNKLWNENKAFWKIWE